eukprot:662783_1
MSLRLGCIVGQACLCYTFLIILLSCIVTTLTTLSMAAIATNDQRTGGACSCMLGPVGGSETIVLQAGRITNDPLNDIRLYGSLLITSLLVTAVFGISWIIKVQFLLFFVHVVAIVSFMTGSFQSFGDNRMIWDDMG